jgi:hypothetical protein
MTRIRNPQRGSVLQGFLAALLLLGVPASGAMAQAVPDFSGLWENKDEYFKPPESGPGPIMSVPEVRNKSYRAEYDNPILLPWVREVLKNNREADAKGVLLSPAGHSSCWPSSGPGVMALRNVLKVLQTPKLVVLLFHNDAQVRYVHLDQPHSKSVPLTWFGESVGHYEGDTLVVDTIGLAPKKMSVLDVFGTPHTDALHVVERFHIVDGGKTLRDDLRFEDPGAFAMPFNAVQYYAKTPNPFEEKVCAENNISWGLSPQPIAAKPDF